MIVFMHVEIGREDEHSVRVWTRYLGHVISVHVLSKRRQQGGDGEMLLCSEISNH